MKAWKIFLLLWLAAAYNSYAQEDKKTEEENWIGTDRPDVTDSPKIMPIRTVQLEGGILFRRDRQELITQTEFLYPRMLLRIGLFKFAELRINGDRRREEISRAGTGTDPERTEGLNAGTIGT